VLEFGGSRFTPAISVNEALRLTQLCMGAAVVVVVVVG